MRATGLEHQVKNRGPCLDTHSTVALPRRNHLRILRDSGCATPEHGILGCEKTAKDGQSCSLAPCPCPLKEEVQILWSEKMNILSTEDKDREKHPVSPGYHQEITLSLVMYLMPLLLLCSLHRNTLPGPLGLHFLLKAFIPHKPYVGLVCKSICCSRYLSSELKKD